MTDNNYNSRLALVERRRRKRRKIIIKRTVCFLLFLLIAVGGVFAAVKLSRSHNEKGDKLTNSRLKEIDMPDWIDEQLIHIHSSARTGTELVGVRNIVIHYVGNPGSTAQNNRDYFNKSSTEVSSHFLVGLDGEVIQCIPLWEKSAASNWRNSDTLSIEVCHPDKTGEFSETTYNSVVRLTAWLLYNLGLDESAVIRHYDIMEKLCPLYYVEHADAWEKLKKDIGAELDGYTK